MLISADEFKRLKRRDREVLRSGGFDGRGSWWRLPPPKCPAEYAHLDAELNG